MFQAALITALIVAPLAIIVWVRATDSGSDGIEPRPAPLTASASVRDFTDRHAVEMTPVLGDAPAFRAPEWTGVVTAVAVKPGVAVANGDEVLQIDGISRLAMISREPLHRSLQEGMVGADVVVLNDFLADTKIGRPQLRDNPAFGEETATAVTALSERLGVSPPQRVADPAWFLWASDPMASVESVSSHPGEPAPAAGTPVVVSTKQLAALKVQGKGGTVVDLAGSWRLSFAGQEFPLADGALDDASLAQIAQLLSAEPGMLTGDVARAEPRPAVAVPASAVVADIRGGACVWLQVPDGFAARPVVVQAGSASGVQVASGLVEGETFLVNPVDVLEDSRCPSV